MRGLRTFISAVAILIGAVLVLAWCASWMVLKAVDDGSAARTLVRGALAAPAVTATIADSIEGHASTSLASRGVDVSGAGVGGQLSDAIAALAVSEEFKATVLAQVDAARERLQEELSRDDRASEPFVISVDVTATVNNRLGDVAVVGSEIPDVDVAPIEVELVSASTFDKARSAYAKLEFAKRYFLWAGLAFIVVGLVVSTRRHLVVPKFLIAIGAMSLGVAAVLVVATPARLAEGLPGGADGPWGSLVVQSFADEALPGTQRTLVIAGVVALVLGSLMALIVKSMNGSRRR